MIHGTERRFDSEAERKRLHLNSDMILDIELGYELKKYFEGAGLPETQSKLEAAKTLKSFIYFLKINFDYYYCEKALKFDQFPGENCVEVYFKPDLRLLLVRSKNPQMLTKHGRLGINFSEEQYTAVRSCFLELSSKLK